jgi:hypothetical protein
MHNPFPCVTNDCGQCVEYGDGMKPWSFLSECCTIVDRQLLGLPNGMASSYVQPRLPVFLVCPIVQGLF